MLRALLGGSTRTDRVSSTANLPPLHLQIRGGDLSGLRRLADKVDNATLLPLLLATDNLGRTATHAAAETSQHEVLKYIIKQLQALSSLKALNNKDLVGCSPLFLACKAGSRKCVLELLKAGADVATVDEGRNSVLHAPLLAPFIAKGHAAVIQLQAYSISPDDLQEVINAAPPTTLPLNALNKDNLTPLQLACQKGAFDCAVVFINAKASTTLVKAGDPPLFSAVTAENSALVRKLLEGGADVAQPNAKGQNLMEILNPKCEIYRVIKSSSSTGRVDRKLHLISEETVLATCMLELPPDVQRLIDRSEVEQHWAIFCSVVRSVAKKKIVGTTEELFVAKKKLATDQVKETSISVTEINQLTSALTSPGDPAKMFKQMSVAGKGGFGMVFQGIGPDKKHWAIKRMAHASDKEKLVNLREAKFLKECSHRNICSYKATFSSQAQHEMWLVMELLEGGTLDESVGNASDEAKHFFEEKHLAYTAAEILKALEYLHDANIVHRDLKSQNIMFTLTGEVKLIDFGAAVSVADSTVEHRDMTLRHMFHVATGRRPWLDRPDNWSELMHNFLENALQIEQSKRAKATVLLHHKWVAMRACTQAELSRILHRIFDVRQFRDV